MRCNWCLYDAKLRAPRWLFFFLFGGGGGGVNSSGEMKSTCRLISMTSESTQESPFIILAGFCQATCQIAPPHPHIHLVSEIRCNEPWANCILCMCVWLCGMLITDKTVKLWKISERDKRPEGYNLKDEDGRIRDPCTITSLRVRSHTAHDVTCILVNSYNFSRSCVRILQFGSQAICMLWYLKRKKSVKKRLWLGRTQFVRQCTTFVHKWNENTVFHLSALQWNTPHFTDVKVRVRYIRHLYLSIRVEAGWLNEAMRLNTSQNHLKWMQKWNIWSQQSSPYVLNKPVFLERPTHGIPARRVQISWLSRNLALSLYAMIAFNPA